jgi:hypothetical protein
MTDASSGTARRNVTPTLDIRFHIGRPYAGFLLGLPLLAVPWLGPVVAVGWLLTALMTRRATGRAYLAPKSAAA